MAGDLYDQPGVGLFVPPFHFSIETMERLALINIEKDPDELYEGFEPQVFEDDHSGRSLRVLAYRRDKRIDVYQQPGMRAVKEDFDVAVKGCQNLVERPLQGARFEMAGPGLRVEFAFEDVQGRPVQVAILENSEHKPTTFSLLAPLGSATENPPSLPLFFLFDFGFVRRAGTRASVKIGEREHRLDTLPLPLAGRRVFFTRYSLDPFLLHWNPGRAGPPPVFENARAGGLQVGPARYTLVEQDGHLEVERLRVSNEKHAFDFRFSPPLPALTGLREGAGMEGRFVISGEPQVGKVSGTYRLRRKRGQVEMAVHPGGGWQPNERLFSVRLIYRLASVFRDWPKTYRWQALFRETDQGWQVQSGWARTAH